jgi:hypothetical protein
VVTVLGNLCEKFCCVATDMERPKRDTGLDKVDKVPAMPSAHVKLRAIGGFDLPK